MNQKDLFSLNQKLMAKTSWACLATVDSNGLPQTRAVSNLRNRDEFPTLIRFFQSAWDYTTFIATDTSSPKMVQIHGNANCSLFYCNPEAWHGLSLCGRLEIIKDPGLKRDLWVDNWSRFYSKKHEDPEYTILKLDPDIVKGWYFKENFYIELDKSR